MPVLRGRTGYPSRAVIHTIYILSLARGLLSPPVLTVNYLLGAFCTSPALAVVNFETHLSDTCTIGLLGAF